MATDYGALLDDEENRLQSDALSASYADVVDAEDTSQRSNLLRATEGTPDGYATARRLEAVTGIPAPVAERNPQEVTRRAQLAQADEVLQRSPVLAAQVAENPDFARLAVDDLDNASMIEQLVGVFTRGGRALAAGIPAFSAGVYGTLEAGVESLNAILPGDPLKGTAQFLTQVRQGQQDLQRTVAGPEAGGRIERAINSGFQSIGQSAAPLAATLYTGNPAFALGGMTASTGGQEYGRARDAGVPISQALPYAASQAAIEYATEKLPLTWFLKDLAQGSGLVKTLAHNVATEVPGEQVATILQDLNEWAVLHPEATFKDYLEDRPGAAADTLIATLVASGTQVGVVKTVETAANKIRERRADADQATQNADALAQLSEAAASSKLRTRDPATFEAFVERAVFESGAAPTDLYISAEALNAAIEQAKIDPATLPPSIAAQMIEAGVSGGDVTIRTSEFASTLAGTAAGNALLPHLRTTPEGMSATEAQAFYDSESEQLAAAVQSELTGERTDAPLFTTPEQAQMTAEEWAAYQETNATQAAVDQLERRTLRDMRWMSNAKAAQLRELKADAAEKRKAARVEVAAEVAREPVYQARQFLTRGTLPDGVEVGDLTGTKLSIPALKEIYGDGPAAPWRYLSTGKFGTVAAEDGIDPNALAPVFGFTSGDQLVRALLEAAPINDRIEAATDVRMLERYGDLSDQEVLERAAEAAIASEVRARSNARELAGLQGATNGRPTFLRAAMDFARGSISQRKIRDLRPAQFAHAEARAARASMQSFKAGETANAAKYKREQLVQNRLNRASTEALEEVESGLTLLRKFNNESTRKAVGSDYIEQIDSLLERFDLRKSVSNRDIGRRKSLAEWVQSQVDQGLTPIIDERLLNEAKRQHYREMTVTDFRNLVDAVKNIEHLGRLKQKLLTAKDEREFQGAVSDLEASIRSNANREVVTKIERNLYSDQAREMVSSYFLAHRKLPSLIREMDGGKDGGAMWERIMRPLNEAGTKESVLREHATKTLMAIFKPLGKLDRRTHIPAISKYLTTEARLAVALNVGNAGNLQRIVDGERWTPAQLQAVLDTLTKEEWDAVQATWDYLESLWPEVAAKELRVSGIAPEKVEATPVQTKFGMLRGGYYPAAADPARSSIAEAHDEATTLKQMMGGAYTRATTRRGHTKARAEQVSRPVHLSLDVLTTHVHNVIHDLSFHEALIDVNRLLSAAPIDEAIRDHYGAEVLRVIKSTIKDAAIGDLPVRDGTERFISRLRSGVSIAVMGWSLTTAAMQPLGFTQSAVRIGPKYVAKGVSRWLRGAATMQGVVKDVYKRSDFMRLRGATMNRELNEFTNQVRKDRTKFAVVDATAFLLLQKMQQVVDVPTWLGAYEKAMDEGRDEATAVQLADQAVIDAQGSGRTAELAAVQRGNAYKKLLTLFMSYFSTTWNLSAESVRRTKFRDPISVAHMASDMLLLWTVPAVLSALLRTLMQGDDEDDESFATRMIGEQLSYLVAPFIGVREVGGALNGFNQYSGPAGTRVFDSLAKLKVQLEQGELDESALRAFNAVGGILFHWPATQVDRTVRGIEAVINEDAPLKSVLFGPPK